MALFEKEFLNELGGGFLSALLDAALEAYFATHPEASGKFPYVPTIEPLPPADDWIVVGTSAAPYLAGRYMRKPRAETMGKGALEYSLGMVLHHIPIRAKWKGMW